MVDSPLTDNGQLRIGQDSIGKDSLSKDKLDKDNINNNISNGIMTEQQLLQAIYLQNIKDRDANNIIECVSYLKKLPIEVIKIALEKTSLQPIPEWRFTRDMLNDWIQKGISSISELGIITVTEAGGFKRKGDEILDGEST